MTFARLTALSRLSLHRTALLVGSLALLPGLAHAQFDFFPGGFNGGFDGSLTPTYQPTLVSAQETIRNNANAAMGVRDFTRAETLAGKAIANDPQDHEALFIRSAARVQMGIAAHSNIQVRAAIADASGAVKILKDRGLPARMEYYIPYLYGMTTLGAIEKNPAIVKSSQDFVNKMLEKTGLTPTEKANFLYQHCLTAVQFEKYDDAIADLEAALKLVPNHYGVFMGLVDITKHHKTPDDVTAVFARAIKAMPANPVIYNNRGLYFQSVDRIPEAVADLTKAIELDPKLDMAYRNRGFTYFHSGKLAEAEADLTKAIDLKPGEQVPITLRGHSRVQQAKLELALEDYRLAVTLAPKNAEAHRDLGFAQFFAGQYAEAIQEFDQVLQLDPKANYVGPWRLAATARLPKVAGAVEGSASKIPETREWYDSLTMYLQGQLDDGGLLNSVTHAEADLSAKQTCEAYYFIALEKQRQNKTEEAKAFFEQAVMVPHPQLSAYRGATIALKKMMVK